ncbi:MAG: molybdopterin-guanine dinucleotide biosynthesis protein B [Burkholderiaceae bacterium]
MKIFGFAGWSGSGKTTLLERLVPLLNARGLRVSLIKHAHHEFDVDIPGKDSHRHRQAGCQEVLIASARRWALMHELRNDPEPTLAELIPHVSPCDLLLVEGFKREAIPKLEIHRAETGKPTIHTFDSDVVAIASDTRFQTALPQFDLDDAAAIADFICQFNGLTPPARP